MQKDRIVALAEELFKIRISSSNEGLAQDDGIHKMKVRGITSYNPAVIEKWYLEALKTAEIVISLEYKYLADAYHNLES